MLFEPSSLACVKGKINVSLQILALISMPMSHELRLMSSFDRMFMILFRLSLFVALLSQTLARCQ